MSQCLACTAPAELYLCPRCVTELRAMLESLHTREIDGRKRLGLLEYLRDEAIGRRNRSDNGRHVRSEPYRLDGDRLLASLVEEFPDERVVDLDEARQQRYRAAQRRALAAGKVNARAAELLTAVNSTLGTWARHIAESRGVEFRPLRTTGPAFIGPLPPGWRRIPRGYTAKLGEAAEWLAYNVHSIALDEAAGQIFAEIETNVRAIEKVINPPVPRKYLGPCPTWNERTRQACKFELWAAGEAIEVTCPRCRRTHTCNRLQLLLVNDLDRAKVTVERILELNRVLPEEYRIPERTLRRWRKPGPKGEPPRLKPRGWLRPDGSHGIHRRSDDDRPLYLWSDVRKLRSESAKKVGAK